MTLARVRGTVVASSRADGVAGTGLGLSITKAFATAHGGESPPS